MPSSQSPLPSSSSNLRRRYPLPPAQPPWVWKIVPTKRRFLNLYIDDETSSSSSSSSSENKRSVLSISGGTFTTPDWLPDRWIVVVLAKATRQKYKVFKETATGKKFYSKPHVLNYHGIDDNNNSNKRNPLEIPKSLYDLIQKVAKLTESLKLNPNNRFAKRKLKYYKLCIHVVVAYHLAVDELPRGWKYDPETFVMSHVPKPPTPPKPKTKTKKKIKITCQYISAFINYDENKHYVNKDEYNHVSGTEFMECKFYKLTSKYIFYMTIEAIEQGIPGVYKTRVECVTRNGAMTLQNFVLKDHEPKCTLVEPLSVVPLNDELKQARASVAKAEDDVLLEKHTRLAEVLDVEVKRWSSGKQGNLHALLSSL
ncbi:hypothetical protein Tco_1137184, partial [Tanacetum coccineum]